MKPDRPELSKEFMADRRRRRMTGAIAELTAECGYEATKIADVVRQARVARKTLYYNYAGKEDLFLASIDSSVEEVHERVGVACSEAGGVWQRQVEAGLAAFLTFVAEQPAAARMCMIESISATPSAAARYDAGLRAFVDLLKRSTPAGLDLPGTIEETLVGGVAWVVTQQIRRGEAGEAEDLLPELAEFVLSPYHGVAEIGSIPQSESDSTVADCNG